VLRGGGWNNNNDNCRSANRNNNNPDNRNNDNGFRVASAPIAGARGSKDIRGERG
jgi:formylglycine-generating enzyme required for sulfatase activity